MPIYEFRCESCENRFETLVRKHDESVACPACSGDQLKKLISVHTVGSTTAETPCGKAPCSPAPMCGGGGCGG